MQTITHAFIPSAVLKAKRDRYLKLVKSFEEDLRDNIKQGLDALITSSEGKVEVNLTVPKELEEHMSSVHKVIGLVGLDLELAGYEFSCSVIYPTLTVTFVIEV